MIPQSVLRSDAWTAVSTHLLEDLAKLREQNDNQLDRETTAALRGKIDYIKELLGQGRTPSPVMQTEGEFGGY